MGDDTDTDGCSENVSSSVDSSSSGSSACTRGFFRVTTKVECDRAKYAAFAYACPAADDGLKLTVRMAVTDDECTDLSAR